MGCGDRHANLPDMRRGTLPFQGPGADITSGHRTTATGRRPWTPVIDDLIVVKAS